MGGEATRTLFAKHGRVAQQGLGAPDSEADTGEPGAGAGCCLLGGPRRCRLRLAFATWGRRSQGAEQRYDIFVPHQVCLPRGGHKLASARTALLSANKLIPPYQLSPALHTRERVWAPTEWNHPFGSRRQERKLRR